MFFFVVLLRALTRRQWLAGTLFVLIFVVLNVAGSANPVDYRDNGPYVLWVVGHSAAAFWPFVGKPSLLLSTNLCHTCRSLRISRPGMRAPSSPAFWEFGPGRLWVSHVAGWPEGVQGRVAGGLSAR
jgi:hypothetical protein